MSSWVLADDVVPVDAFCRALPEIPRVKLWQDVADALGIYTGSLRRIRPNLGKFHLTVSGCGSDKALPVRWVYILGIDNSNMTRVLPIMGMDRFQPLHDNTYRVRFLSGMGLRTDHLKLCGQLTFTTCLSIGDTLSISVCRVPGGL